MLLVYFNLLLNYLIIWKVKNKLNWWFNYWFKYNRSNEINFRISCGKLFLYNNSKKNKIKITKDITLLDF
jgi:hypothetical protein